MTAAAAEFSVLEGVLQFLSYMALALFTENVIFTRALGVTRLLKLVPDRKTPAQYFFLPLVLVQLIAAPLGWCAHNLFFPWLRVRLPAWLPVQALRPFVYLTCAVMAMGVVWLLLGVLPKKSRQLSRGQLSVAACNCSVLGTLLICANQNYNMSQTVAFGLGSGMGYVFAVLVVKEGRRRLRSKQIPAIFRGLPSSLIYIGILSLAIYGLLGGTAV